MAITTAYLAADLAAMIADLPVTAQFGSTVFTCAATELAHEESLLLTGNLTGRAVTITFPASAGLGATFKPQARLQLKFPNPATLSNYEVVSIQLSPDFLSYDVLLKQDNRA